jgi:hypothetical protein
LLTCRTKPETVSLSTHELREDHLSFINIFMSLISDVQPGLINNFVPCKNRFDVFYGKYMPIKTSFHSSPLCCFIHTSNSCIVLNSNGTFVFPTPISPTCYLSKSGIHVTSLEQGFSSSEALSGKSLGTRLHLRK